MALIGSHIVARGSYTDAVQTSYRCDRVGRLRHTMWKRLPYLVRIFGRGWLSH